MKAFWTYTLARFALFAATFGVVWLIASIWVDWGNLTTLLVLFISLVLSSVISIFALAGLRDKLAQSVQERAARMTQRIEESRNAEDVD
jgi:CHASE1-domain containing sensor protein